MVASGGHVPLLPPLGSGTAYPKYLYTFVSVLAECITFFVKWTKEAEIIEICTQQALESNLHRNNTDSMRDH